MPSFSRSMLRREVGIVVELLVDVARPNGMGREDGAGESSVVVPTGTWGVCLLENELFFRISMSELF